MFVADLSVQSEVRRLAEEALQRLSRIDVLVNNAGGYWNTRHITADGLERTFALNYLAPFLLTSLLLGRLKQSAPARVVTVSSNMQAIGRIDFDDLQGERSYSGTRAYNQSKLANVLFTCELARRLQATSVTANALHPGVVSTSFGAEDPGRVQRLFTPFMRPFMKTPAQGAATSIHLAAAPALEQMTGRYFANSKPRKSVKRSYDKAAAARLGHVSTDLINPGPKLKGAVDNVTSWPRTRGFRGALDIPPFPESTERFSEGLLDGEQPAEMPGHSRFLRDGNKIFHTHSAFGRGNEYPPASRAL